MSIVERLRQTSKGKLHYDRNWQDEGRLKEILDEISRSNDEIYTTLFLPKTIVDKWAVNIVPKKEISPSKTVHGVIGMNNCQDVETLKPSKDIDVETLNNFEKVEHEIREYERQEMIKIHKRFDAKRDEFSQFSEELYEKSIEKLKMHRERQRLLEETRELDFKAKDEARQEEIQKRQQELNEQNESYAKMLEERFKEASLKDKKDEEEAQKRIEMRHRINCLATSKQHISLTYHEIVSVVRSCKNLHLVPPDVRVAVQAMNEVVTNVQKILDQIRAGNVQDSDVELMKQLEEKTNDCLKIITAGVEHSSRAVEEAATATQNEITTAVTSAENQIETKTPREQVINETPVAATSSNGSVGFRRYLSVMDNLNKTVESYKDLGIAANFKNYRFNLTKAVNTNVNAISGQSGSHLRDKLDRLSRLLSGHQVEVADQRVSINEHPQGKTFCFHLLAKKFVSHGEKQVSANHEAAFPIAMVIVGLWKQYPAFGDLLLAQLYIKCTYLVPFYIQREDAQSDVDYHSALGYNVVDGVLEEKDSFLKRMSGITRLYAAIIRSPLPSGMQLPHPHGIEFAWMWLANILNMEPFPDITATVLFDFLEVCGSSLQQTYSRQFQKVLIFICQEYFAKIKAVTPSGSGGPITRLENFLQKFIVSGTLLQPEGVLPPNFWFT